jgi:hypothetical protein
MNTLTKIIGVLVSFAAASMLSTSARADEPSPPLAYSVSDDFSTNQNPAGVWSYGCKSTTHGAFTPYEFPSRQFDWLIPAGTFLDMWSRFANDQSAITHNACGQNVYTQDGQAEHLPGATVLWPGVNRRFVSRLPRAAHTW